MLTETHDLISEFPDHEETILSLKQSNPHFARMCDEYREINGEILRIEHEEQAASDFYLEESKKRRLQLLDQIYQMIEAM